MWRDRARLRINFGTRTGVGKPGSVWVGALNEGRQPVTIRALGFYGSEFPIRIDSQDHGELHGTGAYTLNCLNQPIMLDPGQYHEAEGAMPDSVDYGYHVDYPLRAYAEDARGRKIWGEAAPIVRMMVGSGDRPPWIRPHLWEPPPVELNPARVEPRWKLWKRRELRTGDPGRPSAEHQPSA